MTGKTAGFFIALGVFAAAFAATEIPGEFTPDDRWRAPDLTDLVIRPGSALDLRRADDAPAGKFGRVVVNARGRLAFASAPEREIRFMGCSSALDPAVWRDAPDAEFRRAADSYAAALRRQGYNYVRLHCFDEWLAWGNSRDGEITPRMRDRWDYLLAAFEREGIYLQPVMLSFSFFAHHTEARKRVFADREMHKVMFYLGREEELALFRDAVGKILGHVNPYTGMALKDDPAVAVVETYNEPYLGLARLGSLRKQHPEEYALFVKAWREWYAARHGGKPPAGDGIPGPRSPLASDYADFLFDIQCESVRRATAILREAGYRGLVTQNSGHRLADTAAGWRSAEVVDNHAYYAHPSPNWWRAGASTPQRSAAGSAAPTICRAAGERFADRPMQIGEFNHAWWNRWQYELPLTFGVYAAFQDFSTLCIHSQPVLRRSSSRASCFLVANNPVLRAGEFLAHHLFIRRAVTVSPHLVAIEIPEEFRRRYGQRAFDAELTRIALVSGIAVAFPGLPPARPAVRRADLVLTPGHTAAVHSTRADSQVAENGAGANDAAAAVHAMRKKGILAVGNRTDPAAGIYESDTGELLLDAPKKLVKVVTPTVEAATVAVDRPLVLGRMTLRRVTTPGCVALIAVDGKAIGEAARLVVIYSTCVTNRGARFTADRVKSLDLGESVPLLETGALDAELALDPQRKFVAYALELNGERGCEVPLVRRPDGRIAFAVDTAKLPGGPTPFFEIVERR